MFTMCIYVWHLYIIFFTARINKQLHTKRYPFSACFRREKNLPKGNRAAVPSSWRICRYVGKPQRSGKWPRLSYRDLLFSTEPWWVRRKFGFLQSRLVHIGIPRQEIVKERRSSEQWDKKCRLFRVLRGLYYIITQSSGEYNKPW